MTTETTTLDTQQSQGISIPCAFLNGSPVFPVSSQECAKVTAALIAAQSQFERAKKDRDNTFFKSTYADLASVMDACADALAKQSLAVTQPTVAVLGEVYLLTRVLHVSGEWIQASFPLTTLDAVKSSAQSPPDDPPMTGLSGSTDSGGKKKKGLGVQALGSEITYLRRYCLSALLGIAADDDDDGNAAQQHANTQTQRPASGGLGGLGGLGGNKR